MELPGSNPGGGGAGQAGQLAQRAEQESADLTALLERQRARIAEQAAKFDTDQYRLDLDDPEDRERASDRRHWDERLAAIKRELVAEPKLLRETYAVQAHRIEPVGIVYLWPRT